MSTQKKNRMRPLMALLGGIVWMLSLFVSTPARCSSTVSIHFNAQTAATSTPTPAPTARPSASGGGSGGSGGRGSVGAGSSGAAGSSSGASGGAGPAGAATAPETLREEGTARWRVYMKVDLLIGDALEHVASVHMRAGTLDLSFLGSKPDPSQTQRTKIQIIFSEDGRRILDFYTTDDTPGTQIVWPDTGESVPSAAELLHPHIRTSEPYYFDVTTTMMWD